LGWTCNGPSPPLVDIVFPSGLPLQRGIFIIPPLRGPVFLLATSLRVYPSSGIASSLAHSSELGSDTICNAPAPPLADVLFFSPTYIGFSLNQINSNLSEIYIFVYRINYIYLFYLIIIFQLLFKRPINFKKYIFKLSGKS